MMAESWGSEKKSYYNLSINNNAVVDGDKVLSIICWLKFIEETE